MCCFIQGIDIADREYVVSETKRRFKLNPKLSELYDLLSGFSHIKKIPKKTFEHFIEKHIKYETDMLDFLNTEKKQYDLIICSFSLQFLEKEDFKKYTEIILKRMKNGGLFYFSMRDISVLDKHPDDHWSKETEFIRSVFLKSKYEGFFRIIKSNEGYDVIEFTNIGL